MSKPKKRGSITWTDEAGNKHTDTWQRTSRGTSLGSIPLDLHLVDAYCPQGPLTAVLIPNGAGPPLVMVHGPSVGYPVPMLALTTDGLVAVMVTVDNVGQQHVGSLGTPRDSFPVDCLSCPGDYSLDADVLSARLAKGEKTMPLRRGDVG
jgi:hypothetical protein